jgi:hypothetical protein
MTVTRLTLLRKLSGSERVREIMMLCFVCSTKEKDVWYLNELFKNEKLLIFTSLACFLWGSKLFHPL